MDRDRELETLEELFPTRTAWRTPEQPGAASPRVEDAVREALDVAAHRHGHGTTDDLANAFLEAAKARLRGGG